ncbi:MAG: sulfocyanin-like copper-binding protein [Firmicutes bacterium]|nr:sulfocyanin-like copper-binding protein [Bacillota bacterium]
MPKKFLWLAAAGAVLLLSGCGTTTTTLASSPWLKVDSAAHTVDLTLDAGLTSVNGWANFNGYANGNMAVNIPVGYKVNVTMNNDGGIPFEVGVYNGGNHLAFPGAGMSVSAMVANSAAGVFPGQSEQFSFVASKVGHYEIENLLDRIDAQTRPENFGMWDVLNVVSGGPSSITVQN